MTVRLALGALVLCCTGCAGGRGDLPPTYKVTGTVAHKGGRPVTAGGVQFAPVGDATFTAFGDIRADGSFELETVKGRARVPGAPAGEYRVVVMLPVVAGQKGAPAVKLPNTVRIEPRDNVVPIDLGAGRG
jgi:hypothetical protein